MSDNLEPYWKQAVNTVVTGDHMNSSAILLDASMDADVYCVRTVNKEMLAYNSLTTRETDRQADIQTYLGKKMLPDLKIDEVLSKHNREFQLDMQNCTPADVLPSGHIPKNELDWWQWKRLAVGD